ncbi:MAG TPA: GNAT family N-acetyltransferase [Saprospiraceae bacterium]|nr:GNAT family N-acetyltransferase [Saprospiraceae bacterium]
MESPVFHSTFNDLSAQKLYALLQLRIEVFVVEQNCPYQDLDGKDPFCMHMWFESPEGRIEAYCRILPPDLSYKGYASIGRVITSLEVRGKGAGKKLMVAAISLTRQLYPDMPIKISAQCYALPFYEALGFVAIGEEYLEDDIPHKAMILYA